MTDELDFFTRYLPVGKHGAQALKRAYFRAAGDFVATEWKAALYHLCETRGAYMTEAVSHGETVDFFMAVVVSRHNDKPVSGYIEVYGG